MDAVMTPDCNGICSVDETASGSVHVHLKPSMPGNRSSMLRENSLVVLTLNKPPAKGALEWVQGGRGRGARRQNGSSDDPPHKRQRSELVSLVCLVGAARFTCCGKQRVMLLLISWLGSL